MGSSGLADAWDGSSLRKVLKSQYFCKVERRKVRDLDADRRGRLERKACFQKKCRTVVVPVAEAVVRRDRQGLRGELLFALGGHEVF